MLPWWPFQSLRMHTSMLDTDNNLHGDHMNIHFIPKLDMQYANCWRLYSAHRMIMNKILLGRLIDLEEKLIDLNLSVGHSIWPEE